MRVEPSGHVVGRERTGARVGGEVCVRSSVGCLRLRVCVRCCLLLGVSLLCFVCYLLLRVVFAVHGGSHGAGGRGSIAKDARTIYGHEYGIISCEFNYSSCSSRLPSCCLRLVKAEILWVIANEVRATKLYGLMICRVMVNISAKTLTSGISVFGVCLPI